MACGTVNSPEKNYHLEFVVPHMYLSRDLQKFLSDNDMAAKRLRGTAPMFCILRIAAKSRIC